MKLVPILASIVTGFAMLATVGSASASAVEFDLSGTFAPTDAFGSTGLANGSFNGTYSYSEGAAPTGPVNFLSSFSINILNASNVVVDTFNSNNAGNSGSIFGNPSIPNSAVVVFNNNRNALFQLQFPTGSQKPGNLTNELYSNISGTIYATSTSPTSVSQAVPEPSMIAGSIAAGAGLMAARLKKSNKRKAFQVA